MGDDERRSSRGARNPVFTLLGLALVVGVVVYGAKKVRSGEVEIPGTASFTLLQQRGDESCSSPLDYCLRVTCVIKNTGVAAGAAYVEFRLSSAKGVTLHAKSTSVQVSAGESREVAQNFPEAKLFGRETRYSCTVR